MAIKKQFLKAKPVCKVTFTVEALEAKAASVVGDFNQWNPELGTLNKQKNGIFKGVFDLQKDNQFEFKYLIDGVFQNETEADAFVWNDYANTENGVILV